MLLPLLRRCPPAVSSLGCSLTRSGARFASSSLLVPPNSDISKIRNLGIFAHIDSGKTTLTESILVHSGYIPHPGTVDLGTTSTDFLPAERERGITIQSASIPVQWSGHTINVVDTPGHVDFTMEVERAARVVDGAIVVMDGVEGVEGQTEGVWKQLTRYDVTPRILYVNKLDRPGASLPHSLLSTLNRLHPLPLLLALPITDFATTNGAGGEPGVVGLVDLIGGKVWKWVGKRGQEVKTEGRVFDEFVEEGETFAWEEDTSPEALAKKKKAMAAGGGAGGEPLLAWDHPIRKEAILARTALIETLCTHHLPLLEEFFDLPTPKSEIPSHLLLSPASLRAAVRALTLSGEALPVLCGSAYKGIGVEVLLDGARDYLPGPGEVGPAIVVGGAPVDADAEGDEKGKGKKGRGKKLRKVKAKAGKAMTEVVLGEDETMVEVTDDRVVALAFKVVWDDQKGWMTFVRVYSGNLTRTTLFNTSVLSRERPSKILLLYASTPIEVDHLPPGSIGVILGLKSTRTGDTLLSSTDPRCSLLPSPTRLRGVEIPNAVCSVAIQMNGKEEEKIVGEALDRLVRQDPSLRLEWPKKDEATGQLENPEAQTLLHGMGPLHLEISLRRLEDEQGVRARAGQMRVSLKESVREGGDAVEVTETWEGQVVGIQGLSQATVKVEVERLTDVDLDEIRDAGEGEGLVEWQGNDVTIDIEEGSPLNTIENSLRTSLLASITRGGSLMQLPLSHLRIHLTPLLDPNAAPPPPPPSSSKPTSKPTSRSSSSPSIAIPPPAAFARAIHQALHKALALASPTILEPLVLTRISGVSQSDVGKVVTDLLSRGGQVSELGEESLSAIGSISSSSFSPSSSEGGNGEGEEREMPYLPPSWVSPSASSMSGLMDAGRAQRRTVVARVPLASMGDYAGRLRSLSGGGGVFESSEGGWGDVDVGTVRKREEEREESM